jgi:hypothetical protein
MAISSALGSSALLPAGLGFRNTVINGHMRVAQRGTAATSTNDSFPVDRWKFGIGTSGAWTAQQIPTATTATPAGFDYSLNFTKTTGGTVAVGEYNYFVQYIEGNNCSHFDWGTSNAKTLTLSFWVRSGQVGTFGGSLRNSAANYAYCFSYTVNAINTWEYKTIQITGVTGGTWLKDTSTGIALFFDLGSGANARGTAGIATGNYVGTTGTSLYPSNTTGGYINFTGVQLEQNYQPTPFEQRPIGVELELCQRYYRVQGQTSGTGSYAYFATGWSNTGTEAAFGLTIQPAMRSTPSVATSAANTFYIDRAPGGGGATSGTVQAVRSDSLRINFSNAGTATVGLAAMLLQNVSAATFITFDAEL